MSRKYKFHNTEGIYFISFAIVKWIDVFTRVIYKDIFVESLRYCQEKKGLDLFGWCIMSNHIHLMAKAREDAKLPDILRDLKKFTSKKLIKAIIDNQKESRKDWMLKTFQEEGSKNAGNEQYQFWRHDNHPIEVYSNSVIDQKLNYIHDNPVKAGIVDCPEHYRYSSARNYAGMQGLLKLEIL